MPTIRAHRIRLHPTPEQIVYFKQAAGTRRFVYNWGLAEWERQYKAGGKPSAKALKKQFNAIKKVQFPWVYDVTKCVVEGAFMDLATAFTNFFEGRARYPQFKRKKGSRDGFYVANDKFTVGAYWIKLPHIGKVNMVEKLRFEGKIMSARITRTADWWFVSITVQQLDEPIPAREGAMVGVDLGLNRLATLSDGNVLENQKPLRSKLRKLKRLHRSLSRKQKDSHNANKARRKLARLHYRITNIRDDILHKFTTMLVETYSVVVIEDLNIKGMMKNHRLALSFGDAALGRLVDFLESKAEQTDTHIVKVGRFFPSSKKCHQCGTVKTELLLSERMYDCDNNECDVVCDRDLNASLSIHQEGKRLLGIT
jgi:putative transposase